MSNREDAEVFTVISYRRDDFNNVYRLCERVRESYHTEDGGYVPQRVEYSRESEVLFAHRDYRTAIEYCEEMEHEEYLNRMYPDM